MLPITGCAVVVVINPAGPVHTVVTVTGTSTAGSKSTAQLRLTSDPTGRMGEAGNLVICTEFGAGAVACRNASSMLMTVLCTFTFNGDIVTITVHYTIHTGIASIVSSIRQSQRREGESLSSMREHSIIFPPLIGGDTNSRNITGKGIAALPMISTETERNMANVCSCIPILSYYVSQGR